MHSVLIRLIKDPCVIAYGIIVAACNGILLIGSIVFMLMTFVLATFEGSPKILSIILTLGCMMTIMMSIAIIVPTSLSPALENYTNVIGTASSLFGFFYYIVASLFTLGMGSLHNGTLFPMPIYFLGLER